MHLQVVWADQLRSKTSTNHTVATRERTSVIQVCRLTGQCVCYFCTCYMRDIRALIVMPRPLSVSQETIIIVLYCCVQSEVSAVRKLESPLVGSFFVQKYREINPCMELCPL